MAKKGQEVDVADRIGKYQIMEILGKGAAGQVFMARQDQIERVVALKVLFPNLAITKPEMVERFFREAKILAKLHHPNIIAIFEIGTAVVQKTELHYIAMEYVGGGRTLHDMLRNEDAAAAMSFDAKLEMFAQICDALRQAHREGVVHRDLKPMNVFVDAEGTPKVLDFGVSKSHDDEDLTMAGMIIGSPPYMSPEQARAEKVTIKSDVFSLGVMAYELFSGKRPFHATSKKEYILDRQVYPKLPKDKLPVPMRKLDPTLHPALSDMIMLMLSSRPDERPTAERLIQRIDHIKSEVFRRRVEQIMIERGQIDAPVKAWVNPLLTSIAVVLFGTVLMMLRFG